MSLLIDAKTVTGVLLADGWHTVIPDTFTLDSYEFVYGDYEHPLHGGGNSGVCATGFTFSEEWGSNISGPLTAILAVRHKPTDD